MVKIGKFYGGWLKKLKELENIHAFSLKEKNISTPTKSSMKNLNISSKPVQQKDTDYMTKKKKKKKYCIPSCINISHKSEKSIHFSVLVRLVPIL